MAGSVEVANGTYQGYPISNAMLAFQYAPDVTRIRTQHSLTALLSGLQISTLTAQSPVANFRLVGGPFGPNGALNAQATITDLSTTTLNLPKTIIPLRNLTVTLSVTGTVDHPVVVAQLAPVPLEMNGQRMVLWARDLRVEPEVVASGSSGRTSYRLAAVSIGALALERGAQTLHEAVYISGSILPRLNAVATVSGVQLSTAASLAAYTLPEGVAGTIDKAQMRLAGLVHLPQPGTSLAGSRGGLDSMLSDLSGSLSLTLRNLVIVPPVKGATPTLGHPDLSILGIQEGDMATEQREELIAALRRQQIVAAETRGEWLPNSTPAPAAGFPAVGSPATAGGPRTNQGSVSTAASPGGASTSIASGTPLAAGTPLPPPFDTALLPTPAELHFAVGQLNAHFAGKRLFLDTLFLHENDEAAHPGSPGLRLDLVKSPDGTPAHVDLGGGDMSLSFDAPGIPVTTLAPWIPQASTMTGAIFVGLHIGGATSSPEITGSLDAAEEERPLTYGKVSLSVASLLVSIREGSVSLTHIAVGTKDHIISASGQLPFTWHPARGQTNIPPDGRITFQASLGKDNLSALESMLPDYVKSASGPFSAGFSVTGTLTHPIVNGQVLVGAREAPGAITLQHVDQPLKNLVGTLIFNGSVAKLTMFGESDRGNFALGGDVVLPAVNRNSSVALSLLTNGFHLTDHGLIADTILRSSVPRESERRFFYEKVYGYIDSNIQVRGSLNQPDITGEATFSNADFQIRVPPIRKSAPGPQSTFNPRLHLNLVLGHRVGLNILGLFRATPAGSFSVTGSMQHPVVDGHIYTTRGGGSIYYVLGYWRIEESQLDIHYAPPASTPATGPTPPIVPAGQPGELKIPGADVYIHAILKTQITDVAGPATRTADFFSPSGQTLNVQMEVDGHWPNGGLRYYLTSTPYRSPEDLKALLLHKQSLRNLFTGNAQTALPGLFSEVLRQAVIGSALAPYEAQLAQTLGLEEVNVQYQFGGPLYVEVSKHLFDGVSTRLQRAVTGGTSADYSLYFDYRVKGNFGLSYGLLQRGGHSEQAFNFQTFFRF